MTDSDSRMPASMVDHYDVFIDWKGRLGREMPAIRARLDALGARRILDVGCGTGHHVGAMTEAGYEAIGVDPDPGMLTQARDVAGDRFIEWGLGMEPPKELLEIAPFDVVTCFGNVWPRFREEEEVRAAARGLFEMTRPGGGVLVGLKAFGTQIADGRKYLPLIRRVHEGQVFHFIRFLDPDVPAAADGFPLCDMHMLIAVGDGLDEAPVASHGSTRLRAWTPQTLQASFEEAGFSEVWVSKRIDDPDVPADTEDVFVHALKGS